MKKSLQIILFIFLASGSLLSQNWTESFEGLDSLSLPAGWSKWHQSSYPIDPFSSWTIRDTGSSLPRLSTATCKAHSGLSSIGISWGSGTDTNDPNTGLISDEWLVTKRIHVWDASSYMSYWITLGGGSGPYRDSVQIWVSTVDSTPSSFTDHIETLTGTGPYGEFNQNFVPFTDYVGQTIWVGFRYNMDVAVDGYFVNLDDIEVSNPIGIQNISTETPVKYALKQNYPNPFNPITNIEFDIAKTSGVNLVIYNSLGQLVATLVDQELKPGSYKYDFNASGLPSGSYYYRLTAGDFVQTNKMILVK